MADKQTLREGTVILYYVFVGIRIIILASFTVRFISDESQAP